ncbi:MAG: hypothetical protein ABSC05_36980 [Candidatus Solibacter sp.]|jgi:hypothetical protein
MPGFELSKWYADCATDQGDALIVYSAELRWRGPTIHYTNLLACRAGRPARSRFSLREQPPPQAQDGSIVWRSPRWNVEAYWLEPGGAVRETLFNSPAGSLEWNCVAPRSTVQFRIGADEHFRGWGYVEHLRLSLPPWRLPIRQLRWGRFVNATDALVWIDWCGPYCRQVVYDNGAAVAAQIIGDREIRLADGETTLTLEAFAVLREGALGATALAVLPNLDRLFPPAVLNVREQKWLSRAVLRRPGRPDSVGMAIHEVVEWP